MGLKIAAMALGLMGLCFLVSGIPFLIIALKDTTQLIYMILDLCFSVSLLIAFGVCEYIKRKRQSDYKKAFAEWHDLYDYKLESMQKEADGLAEQSAAIIRNKK